MAECLLRYCSRKGIDVSKTVLKASGVRSGELGVFARRDMPREYTVMTVPLVKIPVGSCINPFTSSAATEGIPDPIRVRDLLSGLLPPSDPVLPQLVYLGCVVGAERWYPRSEVSEWLDAYPHPAHDDHAALELHKDVFSKRELDEFREIDACFTASLHTVHKEWKEVSATTKPKPPIQLLYWGLRTALRRQCLFPSEVVKARVGGDTIVTCATMVPVIDLLAHDSRAPNAYVSVLEDTTKPDEPPMLQLRTLAPVKEGEELRSQFKVSQSQDGRPLTLYRFGYLPY